MIFGNRMSMSEKRKQLKMIRAEKQSLKEERDLDRALKAEKQELREYKHPGLSKVRDFVKERGERMRKSAKSGKGKPRFKIDKGIWGDNTMADSPLGQSMYGKKKKRERNWWD